MTEFYFSLSKNVAFGARDSESTKPNKHKEESMIQRSEESEPSKVESASAQEENLGETSAASKEKSEIIESTPVPDQRKREGSNDSLKQESGTKGISAQPPTDPHKKTQDALAAAKARFLARKKAKVNVS